MGAILLYLTIAITFAALFAFVGSLLPKAFSGLSLQDDPALASNLIYFSFITLTTTGYGDIFPVHPIARSLCNLESIVGQLYPATLLARLVTLELCTSGVIIADAAESRPESREGGHQRCKATTLRGETEVSRNPPWR
jgi:hypothetical protein